MSAVTPEAIELVDDFIRKHRAAAIPALIGACVLWAVEHGGVETVKGSLERAIDLAARMEAMRRENMT